MAVVFSRTLRSLRSDSFHLAISATVGLLALLAVWAAWFLTARVSVYEVASRARVEVLSRAHTVGAPVTGRVLSADLEVGREVGRGHLLVALETSREVSAIDQEQAQIGGLMRRLEGLGSARHSHAEAAVSEDASDQAAVEHARAETRTAVAALRLAEAELERAVQLREGGLLPQSELERAEADVDQARAAVDGAGSDIQRFAHQRRHNASMRRALLADYDEQIAEVAGDLASARASLSQLHYGLSERFIQSPVAGRLERVAVLTPGSVVEEGDVIAVVVPEDRLQIVALFPLGAALGRIKPGQRAWMHLDAFPWMQYGKVCAEVTRVGSEVAESEMRVELALCSGAPAEIPLSHGLEGSLAVEVEQVSPAEMILRAVGKRLLPTSRSRQVGEG